MHFIPNPAGVHLFDGPGGVCHQNSRERQKKHCAANGCGCTVFSLSFPGILVTHSSRPIKQMNSMLAGFGMKYISGGGDFSNGWFESLLEFSSPHFWTNILILHFFSRFHHPSLLHQRCTSYRTRPTRSSFVWWAWRSVSPKSSGKTKKTLCSHIHSVVANADRTLRRHGNGTKPQKVLIFLKVS